jgi:hypothetical protein
MLMVVFHVPMAIALDFIMLKCAPDAASNTVLRPLLLVLRLG